MADEPESEVVDGGSGGDVPPDVTSPAEPSGDYDFTDPDSVSQHTESSETAPSEAPSESVTPTEPSQPEISPNLLAIAEELGYPRDVALAFGSQEALKRHLSHDVRNRQRAGRAQRYSRQQQTAAQQPLEQQPYQVPKYELQFDPDAYAADDPVVKQLNALNEHYQQVAQRHEDWIGHFDQYNQAVAGQLQQQQALHEQSQQQSAYQSSVELFDRTVAEMSEYADLLGAGKTSGIDQSSDQWANRDKLFRRWETIEQEYRNAGLPLPPDHELAMQAAQSLFGHSAPAPDTEPSNGERARDPQTGKFVSRTQRPTHRAGKPLSGIEKATSRIDKFFGDNAESFDAEQILS